MSSPPYLFDHLPCVTSVLGHSPLGLITDVDGTISPIAPSPRAARVSPLCARHLKALVPRVHLLAALSGRPAAQTKAMVGVDGVVYVGNHGLEWWGEGKAELATEAEGYRPLMISLRDELSTTLNLDGVMIEDKGVSLAVHYRQSPHPRATRESILAALSRIPGVKELRLLEGRKVIELRPPLEIDKGHTFHVLAGRYGLRAALYLGDDLTDVDAFRALKARQGPDFHGLAVAVVSEETPPSVTEAADLFLQGVSDVERFLGWLIENIDDLRRSTR